MSKDKIIVFSTDLYKGGIASATSKYVWSLVKKYDVCVVVWDNLPINCQLPDNVPIRQLNCPLGANFGKTKSEIFWRKVFRLVLIPYAIISFGLIQRKAKPKMVFSLGYLSNLASILLSSRRIKTIISERTFPGRDLEKSGLKGRLVIALSKHLYKKADLIITPSKELSRHLQATYQIPKERIASIPNFFDLDFIQQNATKDVVEKHQDIFKSNIIITCGRLSRQKGQWFLIRSVAGILKKNKKWKLVFLGDGEMSTELKELAESVGVSDQVLFLGNVKNPHQYISRSKIFVFPSLWEGFPNALVEAMACNVPVIASDCPTGPKEILIENGYPKDFFIEQLPNKILKKEPLIKPELGLNKAIETLLRNKELRHDLASEALKISQLYSKEKVEEELFECIQKVNI